MVVAHTITYILTASGELIRSRQTGLARHRSAERAILQLLLDSLRLVDTAVLRRMHALPCSSRSSMSMLLQVPAHPVGLICTQLLICVYRNGISQYDVIRGLSALQLRGRYEGRDARARACMLAIIFTAVLSPENTYIYWLLQCGIPTQASGAGFSSYLSYAVMHLQVMLA